MREARCFENKERETSILFFVFSLQRRKERGDRVDDESPRCSSSSILLIGGSPRRFFSSNDGGYGGGIKSVALSEDDNRRLLLIAIERLIVKIMRKNFKGSWRTERTRRDSLFLYKEELQRILEKRSQERTSCSAHVLYMYKLLCSRSTVSDGCASERVKTTVTCERMKIKVTGLWRQYTLGKKRSGLRSVFVETVHGFVTGLWRVHGFVV
ncbi:hypothetical protein HID58_063353 [Brassica napus]|uniref:Uncharacterized protein n=1 Tax=Brassica napus TaxID=3708 RepID=A0ABQ8A4L0_BRANA|nr:hypothetical protein HID58_063353 [Brassica napus]